MKKIVIFDGVCGLCNKSIDLLIILDKHQLFKYSSLQGEFVKTLNIKENIDSIIFYEEGKLYYKSIAILRILNRLGGIWKVSSVFYLIPRYLRDIIYDVIVKHRYKIFGKMGNCRLLTEDEKEHFIA